MWLFVRHRFKILKGLLNFIKNDDNTVILLEVTQKRSFPPKMSLNDITFDFTLGLFWSTVESVVITTFPLYRESGP
jgi:hypothetical protein